jgi:hypothetical protein
LEWAHGSRGDVCDISDLNIPANVSLRDNIKTAESHYYKALGFGILLLGPGTVAAVGNHAAWFVNLVQPGGDWDYKNLDPVGISAGKSKYEDFGNFHFGAVGAAAGFDRGHAIQRMAGFVQKPSQSDGGENGGLASIVADFITNSPRGKQPYGDQWIDQRMINRGIAYYKARCHKK